MFTEIPYQTEDMKHSRKTCVNRIGRGIWLEGVKTHDQDKVSLQGSCQGNHRKK